MKKQFLLILMMLLPMLAMAFSGEVVIDGIKYNISTKLETANALGLENPDYSGALVIPGSIEYEGKTCWVTINGSAFQECNGITSLKIMEGVKEIQGKAFRNCANLATIEIPNSLENIGLFAFDGTAWYANQSDGLVYINHIAYNYKGDMPKDTEITIKEGITIISEYCFINQENLKSVSFPSTLKTINSAAFMGCTSISSLVLENINVYGQAFYGCKNLKDVIVNNVTFIPRELYKNTYDYTTITEYFEKCTAIEQVTINCKEVGGWFKNMPSLSSIKLGEMVEKIDNEAFSQCTGLKHIEIPKNVKYLSGFRGCTGLESINIPSSVVELGGSAFAGCTGLTSIEIPSSIVSIGGSAFLRCSGLTSISLPEGLKVINDGLFL